MPTLGRKQKREETQKVERADYGSLASVRTEAPFVVEPDPATYATRLSFGFGFVCSHIELNDRPQRTRF